MVKKRECILCNDYDTEEVQTSYPDEFYEGVKFTCASCGKYEMTDEFFKDAEWKVKWIKDWTEPGQVPREELKEDEKEKQKEEIKKRIQHANKKEESFKIDFECLSEIRDTIGIFK
tara:strand:+ start:192 stop:539 length:348 start_codon:yes stop_codon:yes gene_type:complete